MKLTIKEKQAISTFRAVLDAIEKGKPYEITTADQNAIKSVLGVDFKEITFRKGEVQEFAQSKGDFHLTFKKPFSDWSPANKVKSFGFFPFQVKSLLPKAKENTTLTEENLKAIESAMNKIAVIDRSTCFENYKTEVVQRLIEANMLKQHTNK